MAEEQWVVSSEEAGLRLDKFLAAASRLTSRPQAAAALDRGKVFLNGVEATRADAGRRLAAGDIVRVWTDRPGSASRRGPMRVGALDILYEDAALIVLNKPAGVLAVPLARRREAESIVDHLRSYLDPRGRRAPFIVHRIDRDTSGVVLFAKSAGAQHRLKDQFSRREPERVYWAVVYGHPHPPEGTWRNHFVWDEHALRQTDADARHPRAAEAVSEYRVLEQYRDSSLVEVRLRTGKRNQIRLQAQLRGHPLVGERRYVGPIASRRPIAFARQALHAHRLTFRHPDTDRTVTVEAPVPPDFAELLKRLRQTSRPS